MFQNKLSPIYRLVNKKFSIQISGLEKINPDQNYIFAMNHQSVMDIPISYAVLAPHTNLKINLFLSHIFYNIFFPLTVPLDAISINMNKGKNTNIRKFNLSQLEKGVEKLRLGNSVLIYPEGGMDGARTSEIARGETGPVRLAIRTGIPILPIGIKGTNHAYPFTISSRNPIKHKPEIPVEITIGDEICYQKYAKMDLEEYSLDIRSTLRSLTEELMVRLSYLSGLSHMTSA
jgi:1-acyl-sn-glycerol-3-phosphate acyltransferase